MFSLQDRIAGFDDELWAAIQAEQQRQEDHIELIASENYTSPRVLEAQGTVLTNKYAEGYPGKRYYGGCEHVDVIEQLAIDRAKRLFDADYANARAMARVFRERGYKIVSGGTDNHLFLVELTDKGLTGKAADATLGAAHITVNKNAVPNDPQPPLVTSGIRAGTPAVTTRGCKEPEVRDLAHWICDILDNVNDASTIERVKQKVTTLCARFPVYTAVQGVTPSGEPQLAVGMLAAQSETV